MDIFNYYKKDEGEVEKVKKKIIFPIILLLAFCSIAYFTNFYAYEIKNTDEAIITYINERHHNSDTIVEIERTQIENSRVWFVKYHDNYATMYQLFEVSSDEKRIKPLDTEESYTSEATAKSVSTDKGEYTVVAGLIKEEYIHAIKISDYESDETKEFTVTQNEEFFYVFQTEEEAYWRIDYLNEYGETVNKY